MAGERSFSVPATSGWRSRSNPEAGAVPETSPIGQHHGHAKHGLHRDTITFIPYGDTIFALSTFVGDAASSTTDLPRKASRTMSTIWNCTRESAFTYTVSALKLLSAPGSVGSMPANTFPSAVMATH